MAMCDKPGKGIKNTRTKCYCEEEHKEGADEGTEPREPFASNGNARVERSPPPPPMPGQAS